MVTTLVIAEQAGAKVRRTPTKVFQKDGVLLSETTGRGCATTFALTLFYILND